MDHASARENEDRLHAIDLEIEAVAALRVRAAVQLARLENGARAGGETYVTRFDRLDRALAGIASAQEKLEAMVRESVRAGRQWQRELAVALARDLPRQHVPLAQHARWATAKTKSVTAETIVHNVAPTVAELQEQAAAAAAASEARYKGGVRHR